MSERFYAELKGFADFTEVARANRYQPVPDDWRVVITDVAGSTRAIEAGRYKEVNAMGVASIVALRNAMKGLPIPFVFGGDGATLLAPETRLKEVEGALRGIEAMSRDGFDLEMRTGTVPLRELRRDGFEVAVSKYQASEHVELAMLKGGGVSEAERRVKDPSSGGRYRPPPGPSDADFEGFECRWRPIPSLRGHVMSLLILARGQAEAEEGHYRHVLDALSDILAETHPGRPVSADALELAPASSAFDVEATVVSRGRGGARRGMAEVVARTKTAIAARLLRRRVDALGFPGDVYQRDVSANTDFRKFDDMLRMVIDVDDGQREAIETLLRDEHRAGRIVYGIHCARQTLMTCAIGDYRTDHVHFVDGSDGGYALAAKQLKAQLAARDGALTPG